MAHVFHELCFRVSDKLADCDSDNGCWARPKAGSRPCTGGDATVNQEPGCMIPIKADVTCELDPSFQWPDRMMIGSLSEQSSSSRSRSSVNELILRVTLYGSTFLRFATTQKLSTDR